jgi:uncharacterized 2Fe-2S/4Fe-4S cluster protein (DUF4445 family)
VQFEPHGRTVYVLPGTKVLEAAARAGLTIDTPCGGLGGCGKCRVRLVTGAALPGEADQKAFNAADLEEGWRLACQTAITEDSVVYVPETSLFASRHQILVTSDTQQVEEVQPAVRKVYAALSAPSLQDDVPDLLRLEQVTGPFGADPAVVRTLSRALRDHGFAGTAVFSDHRLIDVEPGDTTAECYGVACDVGTTTLVASLMNLHTGDEAAVVSRMNPQVSFGDDVLSRITHAGGGREGLAELHRGVAVEIDAMISQLCQSAGIARERIYEIVFSGNTTMEHLLCRIDPTQLGLVPFVPVFARGLLWPARDLDVRIHPRGLAYVFPVIGGFVGGDTVAGMLATGLADHEAPALMVDIGTNGEIVLASGGRIWAASTAAGPAFEGARISCGMRATRGAIEKVVISDDVHCSVIDEARPAGLCGSGLIDLGAELLRHSIVTPAGRMLPPGELPPALPENLRRRVRECPEGGIEFVVAFESGDEHAPAVTLRERDIRELQLACGAIRAGIAILLKQAGLGIGDLEHVYIAGGFGSFIRRSNAQRTGLLPPEIGHERIRFVGNTSLSGAKWGLLSTAARAQAEDLARRAKHVELSNDVDFAMEFAMAMMFPEAG